ncbi:MULTISPECIES: DNA adenine methylase [unclassified Anaerobiospirillum]|uniref:DNA adenine methylase n=1 Tax=unclassified Anaerobiospirillum TaxID=2647410 RepID=UPI001FF5C4DC|nr:MULTISPECIES: DNA adenine methylase [unclassified Anaerobiospirillum]MCK0535359.1 DNA adenine methylase [Anaerobiospirillum sp. NML120511]MCK0540351.1 DNA adenine methylase [Anaerobiospirillum sp. NML02-A-032]
MPIQNEAAPVVKWAGGKRTLLPELMPLIPAQWTTYVEPFMGGAAVLFAIAPQTAIVNDINSELINTYKIIRDDVESLIAELKSYENTEEFYYNIRNLDRDAEAFSRLSPLQLAARTLYLNRTCFNGLYRVNKRNQYNTPYGKYKNPNFVNEQTLRAASEFFNSRDITICNESFEDTMTRAPEGAFVYLDPPYDPLTVTSSFTSYAKDGFNREHQVKLKECCDHLTSRGVKFMLSNSATEFILDLYNDYNITLVNVRRNISANSDKRNVVQEVVVRNYK